MHVTRTTSLPAIFSNGNSTASTRFRMPPHPDVADKQRQLETMRKRIEDDDRRIKLAKMTRAIDRGEPLAEVRSLDFPRDAQGNAINCYPAEG